jgi:hypothetical protein
MAMLDGVTSASAGPAQHAVPPVIAPVAMYDALCSCLDIPVFLYLLGMRVGLVGTVACIPGCVTV